MSKPHPDEGWTKTSRIDVDQKTLRSMKDNYDVEKQCPELYSVKTTATFFIGMDLAKVRQSLLESGQTSGDI